MSHLKLVHALPKDHYYVAGIGSEMAGRFVSLKNADGTCLRGKFTSAVPSATEGLTVMSLDAVGQRIRFALPHDTVIRFDPPEDQ